MIILRQWQQKGIKALEKITETLSLLQRFGEIDNTLSLRETYDKYQKIAQDFVLRNARKG